MSESHIRIDEGIKRGPRTQPVAIPTESPRTHNIGILANVEAKDLLTRLLNQERARDIAKELNCSTPAIYQHLLKHSKEDWKHAQVAKALALRDKAEEDVEAAPDALSLARAREALRSAQWSLERMLSSVFGLKGDAGPVAAPVLNITLSVAQPQQSTAAQPLIIDVQSVSESK
jgi:hypothetical protein